MADVPHYKKKKLGAYPYLSVVLSITTALFVLGIFTILLIDARKIAQAVQENLEIQLFLNNAITDNEKLQLEQTLTEKPYIRQEANQPTYSYISKEEAAKELTNQLEEDFQDLLGENPLKDSYVIRLKANYYQPTQLQKVEQDLENLNGVVDVAYPRSLAKDMTENIATISFILFSFALFMSIIVIVLIHNTIKLALFSQRFINRTMQLVCAKNSYERKQLLKTAAWQGIISGVLAFGFLWAFIAYAESQLEELQALHPIEMLLVIGLSLIGIGVLISVISSFRAVNKYLAMSLDELY
ncbi:MAG: cell division protein FtsX [Thermonemataceae bacterium]